MWKIVGLVLLGMVGGLPAQAQQGIVFRYLPGQSELSSPTRADGVEAGPFLDVAELTARAPGGWGMQAPYTAEFDGDDSTLRGTDTDPVTLVLATGFTVEAWVRPATVSGAHVLLTNRVGDGDGVTLGIDGGVPYAVFSRDDVTVRADATEPVEAGTDHWLAATVRYTSGGALELTFYLDGRRQAVAQEVAAMPTLYTMARPFYVGTRATGSTDAPDLDGTLTGQVYAAAVRSYAAADAYLGTPPPFDGGPYFGLPDYHDYELGSADQPMDQRIDAAPVAISHRLFLPYANDEYIPQGTASRFEVSGTDTTALVYIAYYHRLRSGQIETQRSIVAELDALTGRVRRTFRLGGRLATSHAGGVAFHREALYISSVGVLERYPLPAYDPDGPKYIDLAADADGTVDVPAKASFVSAYRDTLWVGDWRTASDVAPYLSAHPVDAAGKPSPQPAAVYALPRNIQGVDLIEQGGTTYVFMARNRNSREAELLRYPIDRLDRYFVRQPDSVITMPHGIEDLSFFPDGTLWTNSESGTDYYQRRTNPWSSFYPFVYAVPPTAILPGPVSTGIDHGDKGAAGPRFDVYPNPFRTAAQVRLAGIASRQARLYVTDLLGRRVAMLHEGPLPAEMQTIRWAPQEAAPGVYFVVLDDGRTRSARPVTFVR